MFGPERLSRGSGSAQQLDQERGCSTKEYSQHKERACLCVVSCLGGGLGDILLVLSPPVTRVIPVHISGH